MRITRREFESLVLRAFEDLPPKLLEALENLAVLVEDLPTPELLDVAGVRNRYSLFGLYQGVPLPERYGGMPSLPDTITLFQRPIESVCSSRPAIVREIRVTLLHEVGHYLGLDEEDLDRLGYG